MGTWFSLTEQDDSVTLDFLPSPSRFWPTEIIRHHPIESLKIDGKRAILTGAGAVWMYAYAGALLGERGAKSIEVMTPFHPGESEDLSNCISLLTLAGQSNQSGALLTIQLQSSPPLSSIAIDRLLAPRIDEISRLRPMELAIAGRASAEVYARSAYNAVQCGCRRITCWSARDGLVVVYDPDGVQLGEVIPRPSWMAQAVRRPEHPIVIGVIGDPNRGKSVFSNALDGYRESTSIEGWKLDCDGQAPTAPWYLSLAGIAKDDEIRQLRDRNKRSWSDEMEELIVQQLQMSREVFPVLIADLPGGNHQVVPPQRLPAGRERMFSEIDLFILIDRDDAPSEASWRTSLKEHALDDRIQLILSSRDPKGPPSLTVQKQLGLWRGTVTGLDRSKPQRELVDGYRPSLKLVWDDLLESARRNSTLM